jgi:tetratricopeptide (TPR) repeat protein
VSSAPELADAQLYLADALLTSPVSKQAFDDAEPHVRQALVDPVDPDVRRLGLAFLVALQADGAVERHHHSIVSQAHILLARVARHRGHREEALAHCRSAASLAPESAAAHYKLAEFHASEAPADAIVSYRRALELDPKLAIARRQLGALLRRSGREREAEQEYRTGLRGAPRDTQLLLGLADVLVARGDVAAGIQVVRAGLTEDPQNTQIRMYLAVWLRNVGRHAEAEPELRRILDADPGHTDARFTLGMVLAELDRRDAAEAELRRAVPLSSSNVYQLVETAKFLLDRSEVEESLAYCRRARRLDPNNKDARRVMNNIELLRMAK